MIIIIEGPTGVGKSNLALALAQALNTEIISADSRQIYRFLDIGTAKPTFTERELVPHHLIDICNPDESYNAGFFAAQTTALVQSIQDRGKIPIICGGTGLYIRAYLEGLFEHPYIEPELRSRLKTELTTLGTQVMHQRLSAIDPAFAARISVNDPQRILRGLEVFEATGKPISEHWAQQTPRHMQPTMKILVYDDRETLYQRINSRLQNMLEGGLIDEISWILTQGYDWNSPGLNSLGYKEFRAYFENMATLSECADLAAQHHRNYAKRQLTWYRKNNYDLTIDPRHFSLSDILGAL